MPTDIQNPNSIVARKPGQVPGEQAEKGLITLPGESERELEDLDARLEADLAALRGLPGVVDAYASNSHPLSGGGETAVGTAIIHLFASAATGKTVTSSMIAQALTQAQQQIQG